MKGKTALTLPSRLRPKMERPAGIPPPVNQTEKKMLTHLLLLLLIMVVFDRKVKITIEKQ